jgi:prephenate dehydrogenase
MAPSVAEQMILVDTAPVKRVVKQWVEEILPASTSYIGLIPAVNPAYIQTPLHGIEEARKDLFQSGVMGVVTTPNTHPQAVKLVTDLVRIMGAEPMFSDEYEIDGLMAAIHILPQVLSWSLAIATINSPGWREKRKLTGTYFTQTTQAVGELSDFPGLAQSMLNNRENTMRVLDECMAIIGELKQQLAADDIDGLVESVQAGYQDRETWWKERMSGNWLGVEGITSVEYPTPKSLISRIKEITKVGGKSINDR